MSAQIGQIRKGKEMSSLCLCVSVVKISFRVLVVKTNGSVLEVADTGQDHRQTVLVGSSNDFLIPF